MKKIVPEYISNHSEFQILDKMIKTFYRLLIYFFSRFIKTDHISDKFPVSIKAIIIDDNKVLCLKNERNEWDLPGGKIEF